MYDSDYVMQGLAVQAASLEARMPGFAKTERRRICGCLETAFDTLVAELAPPLVLEVGAHGAEFSTRCRATLPDARIVAFEAHPEVHERFAPRLRGTGVEYVHRAIAAKAGTLTFSVPIHRKVQAERTTMGSLLVGTFSRTHVSYEVEASPLDEWLGAESGRPNVMWIDVEGAIGMVMDGAPRTLDACLALYMEVETEARWPGQLLDRDVFGRLAAHGLVPVLRDVQRRDWQYNVLLVRRTLLGDPRLARVIEAFFAGVFAPDHARAAIRAGAD